MISFAGKMADAFYRNADSSKIRTIKVTYVSLTFITVLGFFLSWFIVKSITRPLSHISKSITKIATGDLKERIDIHRKDEIGHVANALRALVTTLKTTAQQADIIATGDYAVNITLRTDYFP